MSEKLSKLKTLQEENEQLQQQLQAAGQRIRSAETERDVLADRFSQEINAHNQALAQLRQVAQLNQALQERVQQLAGPPEALPGAPA